jgi:hypothetical protein
VGRKRGWRAKERGESDGERKENDKEEIIISQPDKRNCGETKGDGQVGKLGVRTNISMLVILISRNGRSEALSDGTCSSFVKTSSPPTSVPKTVCLLSR